MVAKKNKSKRMSTARRNKITKFANEKHRKDRKESKKNPNKQRSTKKDPGIPNLFPFKDKLLNTIQQQKEQKQQAKEDAKKNKKKADNNKSQEDLLSKYASQAMERGEKFSMNMETEDAFLDEEESCTSGRKDNSKKAYYKEFKKVVESSNVILEILDVRDPLGCRTKQIEKMILESGSDKRIILVLNKIDLVTREVVEKWLKYLRNEFPTVAFKASTQSQRNLSHSKVSINHASPGLLSSSECLGADTLMKLLKNYCRNNNIKTSITVGVVGFPNVGKSSLINSLKRTKVCSVGSTPGVTKSNQEIHLDKNIKLIDSPGIVFAKSSSDEESAEAILRNAIKVELVQDPIAPVELIIQKCKKEQLMMLYNIPYFETTSDFLIHIARVKGRIRKGGVADVENAARCVLQDWNSGKIHYYVTPPESGTVAQDCHVGSAIVEGWSREFEVGENVDVEVLKGVKSKSELTTSFIGIKSGGICELELDNGEEDEESDEDMEGQDSDEDSEMSE